MSPLPNLPTILLTEPNTYRIIRAEYYTRRMEADLLTVDDNIDVKDHIEATIDFYLSKIHSELLTQDFQNVVFGVPGAKYINDTFELTREGGNRFNDSKRGAWYCAFSLSTACKEVGFHVSVELANIETYPLTRKYQVLKAGFIGDFHDARAENRGIGILDPDISICVPNRTKTSKHTD